jgi:hypothetical protein
VRVFAGGAEPDDVRELARRHGCRVAVVTVLDKAWNRDPFAASAEWRLAETEPGRWRIYVAIAEAGSARPASR